MRGVYKFLVMVASFVSVIAITKAAGRFGPGWEMVGLSAGLFGFFILKSVLDERAFRRRFAQIGVVLDGSGPMPSKEKDYQHILGRHICETLTDAIKLEAPLPTGTKVDTWFHHDGDDWYVTIKRGLYNQQRLTLQGEIEDILLHAPRSQNKWIIVVVGLDAKDPIQRGHLNSLRRYASARHASARAGNRTTRIEIAEVPLQAEKT